MNRKLKFPWILTLLLTVQNVHAEDDPPPIRVCETKPQTFKPALDYFKYMTKRKVTVTDKLIDIRFTWEKPGNEIFCQGEEFELGVTIDPKQFAEPELGHDTILSKKIVDTNMECGSNDVYNYSSPLGVTGRKELYNQFIEGCKLTDITQSQKDFLWNLTSAYTLGPSDKAANFVGVSTCPEKFEANKEYFIKYFLKPIVLTHEEKKKLPPDYSCTDPVFPFTFQEPDESTWIHNEWGFFWIRGKVQSDTLFMKDKYDTVEEVSIADCPYLVGLPPVNVWVLDKLLENYIPNNTGVGATLFNQGCTPATDMDWGDDEDEHEWKLAAGVMCRDCDGDKLYDSDFSVPLYGDKVGDCDDRCANITNKPNLSNPDVPIAKSTYCSQQCGGNGCDEDRVPQNACYLPNWCKLSGGCKPWDEEIKSCGKNGTKKRMCVLWPLCTWSDWGPCQEKDPGPFLGGIFVDDDDDIKVITIPPFGQSGSSGAGGNSQGGSSGQAGMSAGGASTGGAGQAGSTSGSSGTAGTGGQGGSNQAGTSGAGGNTGSAGTSSCVCTSGICCNGCTYHPASTQCGSTQTYRCAGTNPGDDAQVANVFQFCSGSSSLCNGAITQDAWQTYEACGSTELCLETGGLPYCSAPACSDVYKTTTVQDPCYSNPQNPNSPELCLEVNQISGSTWEYRICKSSGTFQNEVKFRLRDQNVNHPKNWNWQTYSGSSQCTPWKNFDLDHVTQTGTSQGAGLQADLLSPSSCVDAVCTLRTGQIGIYKTCE